MTYSWLALVPPVIVLGIAFWIRRLIPGLIVGLFAAALFASDFSIFTAIILLIKRLWYQATDIDALYNFSFLLSIGVIISLLNATGGASAFARTLTRHLKNRTMVETSSILLSLTLFIDDYLSNLTVGYVIRPLSDRFSIPRTKLAFLVHSLTGPLVILAPISSWAAMITGQLEQAGVSITENIEIKVFADPFYVYLKSIPFIFYSLLLICSVWFIVRNRISFGPMHKHEIIAQETGNLFGGNQPLTNPLHHEHHTQGNLSDLLVPLITLVGAVLVGIPMTGGYWLFGGSKSLLESFKNNNQTFFVLFMAGLITMLVGFGYAIWRKRITFKQIPIITKQGLILMYSPILMVFFASSLGTMLRIDLQTGPYLASLLLGKISMYLLPFMFFISSLIIAITTGSAWGTIALMLPIAIPMLMTFAQTQAPALLSDLPLLLPTLGAIFSGAVCGDHISPVSETTIMASTSSGCYPVDHAITQFPYAAPALFFTCIAFLVAGYCTFSTPWLTALAGFSAGLIPCLLTLSMLNQKKQ
jgi:Na+/H+ antiporter NhaC